MSASPKRLLRLLTVRAIASASTIPPSTIYRYVASGDLVHYRLGKSVRIAEEDWDKFIQARREAS